MSASPNPAARKDTAPVASPCTSVCRMDPATGYCVGCWRTIEEIASWSRLSDDERRLVLTRVAARRRAAC